MQAEQMAQLFREIHDRLAPLYAEDDQQLMITTCGCILNAFRQELHEAILTVLPYQDNQYILAPAMMVAPGQVIRHRDRDYTVVKIQDVKTDADTTECVFTAQGSGIDEQIRYPYAGDVLVKMTSINGWRA